MNKPLDPWVSVPVRSGGLELEDPVVALRRATQWLSRRLRSARPADGLPTTKLSLLAQLMDHGSLTPGELARLQRATPQALTRSLDGLVRDGMVERSRSVADKRQHVLTITPMGLAALATDAAPRDAWLDHAMAELLTPAERQLLGVAAVLMARLAGHDPGTGRDPNRDLDRATARAGASRGAGRPAGGRR